MKKQGKAMLQEKSTTADAIIVMELKWRIYLLFYGSISNMHDETIWLERKKDVDIQCPNAVMLYNKFIGAWIWWTR